MAIIRLKAGADPAQVAGELREAGITMGQRLADGRYVAYVDRKKWLCAQYPELAELYAEDREFWRGVRRRTRGGEDVDQAEIYAHGKYFNERFDEILKRYESKHEEALPAYTRGI